MLKLKFNKKLGFRYLHGKLLIYRVLSEGNPKPNIADKPSWAVDVREILAMLFVGGGAICLITRGDTNNAMVLLVGLLAYATGRTVPGGK